MVQVYIEFFKIFVFLALGFVLNKTKVIDGSAEKALSKVLLTAVLPFMILNSSQHTYSSEAVTGMVTCAAFGVCYYALTLILMRLSLKKANMLEDEKRIMVTCTVFANTGFVGFPLMEALFGAYGLLLAANSRLGLSSVLMWKNVLEHLTHIAVILLVIIVESQFDSFKKLRQELLAAKREAGRTV